MDKLNDFLPEANQSRRIQLDRCIEELFGELAPDEVDILAQDFSRSTTRMISIIKVGARGSWAADLMDDTEFKSVLFPESIKSLLRRDDVFLITMGLRNDRWHVLYLSPCYQTESY